VKGEIVITHRATAKGVATTLECPWSEPITKTWSREGKRYVMHNMHDWDEEPALPDELKELVDHSMTGLCRLLEE
jgi:hypothetical protein